MGREEKTREENEEDETEDDGKQTNNGKMRGERRDRFRNKGAKGTSIALGEGNGR